MKRIKCVTKIVMALTLIFGILPSIFIFLNGPLNAPIFDYMVLKILGFFFLVIGLSVVINCTHALFIKPKQTMPSPAGAPKRFIVDGLYRNVRNPMYIGDFMVILSIFCLFGHLLLIVYLILAIVFVHLAVIVKEEKELERSFGADYLAYKKHVKRWMPNFRIYAS